MTSPQKNIRVKLVARGGTGGGGAWAKQCPGGLPQWGHCTFICDAFERDYDWLVATDDIPRVLRGKEKLDCPPCNTVFVTSEPSSVTRYGKAFAAQFGTLLTSQEEWALPHKNAIRSQTGNIWFYGKSYDDVIAQEEPIQKSELISTVCSSKRHAHTMHARRYDFTQRLKAELPELEIFGHGVRYIEKKSEALDPYKFHLAIENHIAPHVWTEKLADAFLGYTVPIYCGCPNVFDYFPEDSVVQIDINDIEGSIKTVQRVLTTEGEYERRLAAVKEARRRVIEEYNLPAMLSRIVENAEPTAQEKKRGVIYNRRMMRMRHPAEFGRFATWRIKNILKKCL